MFTRILDNVINLRQRGFVATVLAISSLLHAQDTPAARPEASVKVENFSGTVLELNEDTLAVVRKSLAREEVTKHFQRDNSTRVEGVLRVKSRVTVRYKSFPDGVLKAVYIIVR